MRYPQPSTIYLSPLLAILVLPSLIACGGGGGGGNPAPTVSATSPADGATGVARDSTVTATFNKDILGTSVDTTSFRLSDTAALSGTVSFNGDTNVASFTPDSQLERLTTYTATLTTAITDLSGNAPAGNYSWSFTSADGSWGTPGLVETNDTGDASDPRVGFDTNGNALAVWSQWDGVRANIWANRYDATTGWGTPELIENDNAGGASYPQIAVAGNGDAMAVWQHSDGSTLNIWASRYVSGSGWQAPTLIDGLAGDTEQPRVAIDANGNAMAVWRQTDGTRYNIYSNRYTAGSGWVGAGLLEFDDAGYAIDPQLAMNTHGNAIAIWRQSNGSSERIWARHYQPSGGWNTEQTIDAGAAFGATPQIALDANSNAMAIWIQDSNGSPSVWTNRHDTSAGWGTAQLLETDAGWSNNPQVAMDTNGNALAVWEQDDMGSSSIDIWAGRYTVGTGWGTPELIETNEAGSASAPQVVFDDDGNALAVWQQGDNMLMLDNIWANRYVAGTGWTGAELIETDDTSTANDPQIAIDGNGNALAVWSQSDLSNFNIWSNRFE